MKFNVIEVKESIDGGAEIIVEFDQEYKELIKRVLKIKRFSKKKFNQFVNSAIQQQCNSWLGKFEEK